MEPRAYKAKLDTSVLATREEVVAAMANKVPLIDNRDHDYYMGLAKSSSAKVAGTLPGATVLPQNFLTIGGGGKFRSKADLERIYKATKVPVGGAQITFCNTGHLASVGWFVSREILGNRKAKLYDGSMAEWTSDGKRSVLKIVDVR